MLFSYDLHLLCDRMFNPFPGVPPSPEVYRRIKPPDTGEYSSKLLLVANYDNEEDDRPKKTYTKATRHEFENVDKVQIPIQKRVFLFALQIKYGLNTGYYYWVTS
ncbi:hypothetical protein NPIL_494501 [Nephila pilipes]|uniref:Uncharacterized protein n=1 Tax=Nephila pilipes TaxID=299642 RepID=A0A8X6PZ32_NEPPI|nr:hypothetical protein NPIL_494501 [Nephila pilipes]